MLFLVLDIDDELAVLSEVIEHHVPNKLNCNRIHNEAEQFHQKLVKDISHTPNGNLTWLKTKLRSTCEDYGKIHVPYKYKTIIDRLWEKPKYLYYKIRQGTVML